MTLFTTNLEGLITYVNPAFARLFEVSDRQELLNQPLLSDQFWVNPNERSLFMDAYAAMTFESPELALRSVKGRDLHVTVFSTFVTDGHGEINGRQGIVYDLTERREAKKQQEKLTQHLEKAEEGQEIAENANNLKSQFLANISHEIRTPLNAVIGFTEGIIQCDSVDKIHNHARTILQESNHLLQIINQVLDHAKIEAGKIDLEHRFIDLSQLIQDLSSTTSVLVRKKNLELRMAIDEGIPEYIMGDELRLRQILINLTNNAVKFTENGFIEIGLGLGETQAGQQHLRFSVTDTGIGIAPDKQQVIFETYRQADDSTTREFGGTGLGMAICRKLVELMEGQIGVESEPGKGSTFWVTIPFEPCETPTKAEEMALLSENCDYEPPSIDPARILVVEDYEPNQDMMKMHLSEVGHSVDIASDGKQAVAMCEVNCYDLIFMDVQMPVMNGYQATQRIRSGTSARDLPIIALTANAERDTQRTCLEVGMNDVITKPIRRKALLNTAGRWLNMSGGKPESSFESDASDSECSTVSMNDPLDFADALRQFRGKQEILVKTINKFLAAAETQIRVLDEAVEKGDREILYQEAHKIRGGAASLTAMPLAAAAQALEEIALAGTSESIAEQLVELKSRYAQLKQHVELDCFSQL